MKELASACLHRTREWGGIGGHGGTLKTEQEGRHFWVNAKMAPSLHITAPAGTNIAETEKIPEMLELTILVTMCNNKIKKTNKHPPPSKKTKKLRRNDEHWNFFNHVWFYRWKIATDSSSCFCSTHLSE